MNKNILEISIIIISIIFILYLTNPNIEKFANKVKKNGQCMTSPECRGYNTTNGRNEKLCCVDGPNGPNGWGTCQNYYDSICRS